MLLKAEVFRSRNVKILLLAGLLALTFVLFSAGRVLAQDPQPPTDDQVNAVAKELYCPVCENIPLDVCPTQACAQWRELIRLKLSQGWSADEIRTYFAQQYGDRVLAMPPLQGFNWVFYALLGVFLVLAVVVYLRVVRTLRHKTASTQNVTTPAIDPAKDEYLKRVEEELQRREKGS
ncbi:MAG TPA: cytochrome c-type biogenesis protein CcmH [Longilinea sp.]|nr:cytochrome c-type biogenesis protein CcmH [Longilinea sp.]